MCLANNVADGTACTDDQNVCSDDVCSAGQCAHPAGNAGTMCRDSAGICDVTEFCSGDSIVCPVDGFNTGNTCRASEGVCDVAETCDGSGATCPADGFAAATQECRTAAGVCDLTENCTGSAADCPADDTQGSEFTCRIAMGECDLAEVCDGENTACPPDEKIIGCEPEICRTAGFWSTHGGAEKKGKNVTQSVLDAADPGCPIVCGEVIDDTLVNSPDSALEATCVSIKGQPQLQLARQLTAAALNCIVSQGNADCTNVSIQQLFQECNTACAQGSVTANGVNCIAAIDCFNNGGDYDGSRCIIGTCGGDMTENATMCSGNQDCAPLGNTCVRPTDTCHDQPIASEFIPILEPTGGASSSKACNNASGNRCTVVGAGESRCTLPDHDVCNAQNTQ